METKINGCSIGSFRKLSTKCRACGYKDYCSQKRMQAEAFIIPEAAQGVANITAGFGITTEDAIEALSKVASANIFKTSQREA